MINQFNNSRPSSPTLNHTTGHLPYHWDGECHLVVNDAFYSYFPHTPEKKALDLDDNMDFDLDFDMKYEPMDAVEDYMTCESKSLASTNVSASTAGSIATILEPKTFRSGTSGKSLDAQLDFIMETTKKPPKALPNEKKNKRSRKTPEQLLILGEALKELENGHSMGKKQVAEMAVKTGLTEMKVYKWFWDRGYKLQ